MLKIRNVGRKRRGLKNAKVVERELCSILTPGTRTLSTLEIFDPSDDNVQLNPAPLLALFRVADTAAAAAVDAALGEFLFCLSSSPHTDICANPALTHFDWLSLVYFNLTLKRVRVRRRRRRRGARHGERRKFPRQRATIAARDAHDALRAR